MSSGGVELVIKNIPLTVEDRRLKDVLQEHGQVVNVELKTFGWFGQKHAFVQFATKENAKSAFQKLNNSKLEGNKIKVHWIETELVNNNKNTDIKELDGLNVSPQEVKEDPLKAEVTLSINSILEVNKIKVNSVKTELENNSETDIWGSDGLVSSTEEVKDDPSKAEIKLGNNSTLESNKIKMNLVKTELVNNNSETDIWGSDGRDVSTEELKDDPLRAEVKLSNNSTRECKKIKVNLVETELVNYNTETDIRGSDVRDVSPEEVKDGALKAEVNLNKNSRPDLRREVIVEGLSSDVTRSTLKDKFAEYGMVERIYVAKSRNADEQYGIITLDSNPNAQKAINALDQTRLCGKIISAKWSHGTKEVLISGLPSNIDKGQLREALEKYGRLVHDEIRLLKSTEKGEQHTFVRYDSHASALNAVKDLNWKKMFGTTITAMWTSEIKNPREKLYVTNLPPNVDKVSVKDLFDKFGQVVFVRLFPGKFDCYGFVRLASRNSAERAIKALNMKNFLGKNIRVAWDNGRDSNTSQREMENNSSVSSQENKRSTDIGNATTQRRREEVFSSLPKPTKPMGRGEILAQRQAAREQLPCLPGRQRDNYGSVSLASFNCRVPPPYTQTFHQKVFANQSVNPYPYVPKPTPPEKELADQSNYSLNPYIPTPSVPSLRKQDEQHRTDHSMKTHPDNKNTLDEKSLVDQSINHRLSSIVHKYSAQVSRVSSKELVPGVKYVLEVSNDSEIKNLAECLKNAVKMKDSVGDVKEDAMIKAAESLGAQLATTQKAVNWTQLASFYEKCAASSSSGTDMTETEVLLELGKDDVMNARVEGSINQLKNQLRSIVAAFEDLGGGNGVVSVPDIEDSLRKVEESLEQPLERGSEEMVVWAKAKIEDMLDMIKLAWNIIRENVDMKKIKIFKETDNPLKLFGKKYFADNNPKTSIEKGKIGNDNVFEVKDAGDSGKKCLLSNSESCVEEKKNLPKSRNKEPTDNLKNEETGHMRVSEIETLVKTHTQRGISNQMNELLNKLDRDQDGWIFFNDFEAALTSDFLHNPMEE